MCGESIHHDCEKEKNAEVMAQFKKRKKIYTFSSVLYLFLKYVALTARTLH